MHLVAACTLSTEDFSNKSWRFPCALHPWNPVTQSRRFEEWIIGSLALCDLKLLFQQKRCEELNCMDENWRPREVCGFPSPDMLCSSGCFQWGSKHTLLGSPLPCFLQGQQAGAQRGKPLSWGWVSACHTATMKGCDRCLPGHSLVPCAFTKDNKVTGISCFWTSLFSCPFPSLLHFSV